MLFRSLEVAGAYIHNLKDQDRSAVDTSEKALKKAVNTVVEAAEGIKKREFVAKPDAKRCGYCDVRSICKSAAKKITKY